MAKKSNSPIKYTEVYVSHKKGNKRKLYTEFDEQEIKETIISKASKGYEYTSFIFRNYHENGDIINETITISNN